MHISNKNIATLKKLCQKNKVSFLAAFGSVIRDDFTEKSDIDFVVDFDETDPLIYTELYFNLKDQLEILLKKPIDLIEQRAIKNPFFKQQLIQSNTILYGN